MNRPTIHKTIHLAATPDRVFGALTSSEEIVRYFPLRRVTSTWTIGSEILLEGEINGIPFRDYGRIEILDKPTRFKYTYWSDNHGTPKTVENHLTIDYRLTATPEGTRLDLEHANLLSTGMLSTMDAAWDQLLGSLADYIAGQSGAQPD